MLKDTKEVIKSSKSEENSHTKKQQQQKRVKRTNNDDINIIQETKIEQRYSGIINRFLTAPIVLPSDKIMVISQYIISGKL
jgi:hypothetical protein